MKLRGLMKKETIRRLRIVEELYFAHDYLTSEQLLDKVTCTLPVLISDVRFLMVKIYHFKFLRIRDFIPLILTIAQQSIAFMPTFFGAIWNSKRSRVLFLRKTSALT